MIRSKRKGYEICGPTEAAPFDLLRVLAILIKGTVILSLSKDDCSRDFNPQGS
jgi:hypothetical protein